MSFTYKYARPAVTIDAVLMTKDDDGQFQVLLIERRHEPFQDHWAFPGGFLDENENPLDGAYRELKEETGIEGVELQPLGFWGRPGRDPRGHTVSLVYIAIIVGEKPVAQAADDAKNLGWFPIHSLPQMAFDHAGILAEAVRRLS